MSTFINICQTVGVLGVFIYVLGVLFIMRFKPSIPEWVNIASAGCLVFGLSFGLVGIVLGIWT